MTPLEMAIDIEGKESVAAIVQWCAVNGVVHIDSECFLCCYYTHSSLIETKSKKSVDKPDTIYVYMMAGNMKKAFSYVKHKNYLMFERFDGRKRLYNFDRFRRLCDGKSR